MPPSSISNAARTASSAALPSTCRSSRTRSAPPQAGHNPYGKANPSLTLRHESQRQDRRAPAQQTYASSPSRGRWHLGQSRPGGSATGTAAKTGSPPSAERGVGGTKASAASRLTGQSFFP